MSSLVLPKRIYGQYATKPKFCEWLNITRKLGAEISDGARLVREMLDLEKASGESLKIIGRIVVIDRIRQEVLMNAGVFDDPDGTNFDNKEKLFAEWSTLSDSSLSDEMLRFAIRAKIIKNTSCTTTEDLLEALNFLFPSAHIFRLINYHDMSFAVEYTGVLTELEAWLAGLLDFIPTPQGVRFRGFISSHGIIEFLETDDDFIFGNKKLEFMK